MFTSICHDKLFFYANFVDSFPVDNPRKKEGADKPVEDACKDGGDNKTRVPVEPLLDQDDPQEEKYDGIHCGGHCFGGIFYCVVTFLANVTKPIASYNEPITNNTNYS